MSKKTVREWDAAMAAMSEEDESDCEDVFNVRMLHKRLPRVVDLVQQMVEPPSSIAPRPGAAPPLGMNRPDALRNALSATASAVNAKTQKSSPASNRGESC